MTARLNIAQEVAALRQMTVRELRERYAEIFGEATRSGNKAWLWKRIAWRMQANAEGDLTERALRRAMEIANDSDLRLRPPVLKSPPSVNSSDLMPGSVLTRKYKGQTITVTILDNGFEFNGEIYRSLSAIANAVTGSHWSGHRFFGLKGPRR